MANKYMNSADRAEDNRSSAWTLLIVGGLGLAVIILGALGVLPIPMRGFSKGLSMFVLGGLCVLFIIMGFVSFKKSKVYAAQAEKEGDRESKIFEWFDENCNAEKIDAMLGAELMDIPEEEQYLKRYAVVSQVLMRNFPEFGKEFVDHMADAVFEYLYGEE